MTNCPTNLYLLGFSKEKGTDGSERYYFIPDISAASFWTLILVKPIDCCWQVTYTRSEDQVGFFSTHSIVTKIEVNVHSSFNRMISEVILEKEKKPGLFRSFMS